MVGPFPAVRMGSKGPAGSDAPLIRANTPGWGTPMGAPPSPGAGIRRIYARRRAVFLFPFPRFRPPYGGLISRPYGREEEDHGHNLLRPASRQLRRGVHRIHGGTHRTQSSNRWGHLWYCCCRLRNYLAGLCRLPRDTSRPPPPIQGIGAGCPANETAARLPPDSGRFFFSPVPPAVRRAYLKKQEESDVRARARRRRRDQSPLQRGDAGSVRTRRRRALRSTLTHSNIMRGEYGPLHGRGGGPHRPGTPLSGLESGSRRVAAT